MTFTRLFNKKYSNEEEAALRLNIFKTNVDYITSVNSAQQSYQASIHSNENTQQTALSSLFFSQLAHTDLLPQLGLNEFADQTWEEFSSTHLGLNAGEDGSFRCALQTSSTTQVNSFAEPLLFPSLQRAAFPQVFRQYGFPPC